MGGIFGGLLGLFNVLGGAILFLLIGSNAWKATNPARTVRLVMGSILVGCVAGAIVHTQSSFDDEKVWPLYYLVTPAFAVALITGLELIRRHIDKD